MLHLLWRVLSFLSIFLSKFIWVLRKNITGVKEKKVEKKKWVVNFRRNRKSFFKTRLWKRLIYVNKIIAYYNRIKKKVWLINSQTNLGNEILNPEAGKVVSSNLPNKSIDMNNKCALNFLVWILTNKPNCQHLGRP